jgi:hypothetical protein
LPPNNQAATQPVFNLEMANVYLKAHNPQFCDRTWSLVSDEVKHTKARWEKFISSEPLEGVLEKKTHSDDLLPFSRHA